MLCQSLQLCICLQLCGREQRRHYCTQEHSPRMRREVDISAGPKMRGHISGQISSGLGMTAASVTAMPTMFPVASACGATRTRPFWYISQSLHEQRASWTISMGGLRHMPVHPLKAWLFSEWWMPVASTGVSTSSVNISAGGAGHYHIVSDQSRPVENCADWTTRKSGAFSLLHSGTKPGLPGDQAMHFVVDCLSKSIHSVNIPMGINSTSSPPMCLLVDLLMLKRSPGLMVRDSPSSISGLLKKTFSLV